MTFLDYFFGVGLYSLFAANFNTTKDSWADAHKCFKEADRVGDLIELVDCQKVIVPVYLYALAALCVALAVIELFLILQVTLFRFIKKVCCTKERNSDLQVLRIEARRSLEYEL